MFKINQNKCYFSIIIFHLLLVTGKSTGECQAEREGVLVSTSAGKVLGFPIATRWGTVVQYFGIPYSEIPTEKRRFLPSVPLLGQDSSINRASNPTTHHNTRSPPACIQPVHHPEFSHPSIPQGGVQVSEDCLRMNIYQPFDISPNEKLPIMMFVPGNGYSFADMVQYNGSALAAVGRIIFVTINYRVGVFGFASMGNSVLPGNAGLSDIASALQFIIHNAKAFNGDPNRITVGGRFSGAMAITTLIASPLFYRDGNLTQPLAKRVIIHGGAATSEYNVDSNPSNLFSKFVAETDCLKKDGKESLACLQELEVEKLQKVGEKFIGEWKPAIDGVTVLRNPLSSIEFGHFSSDISFLVGDNLDSGSICYDTLKYLKSPVLNDFDTDSLTETQFSSLASSNIKEFYKIDDPRLIGLTAHEYYFRPENQAQKSWRDAFLRFCGALYVRNPVESFARYASRLNSIVYRYEFAYRPSTSIHPPYFEGALGDEIIALFPTNATTFDELDLKITKDLLQAWTNFIKTGNPSAWTTWHKFNEINKMLTGITGNRLELSTTNNLDADVDYWHQVFLPLQKSLSDPQTRGENVPVTVMSPHLPRREARFSVLQISLAIIVLTFVVTTLVYVFLLRVRGRGGKWYN